MSSGVDSMTVVRLANRNELNRACQKGGYLINIDPVQNVIHACDCQWVLKMDPEKRQGGSYYCKDFAEAVEWMKARYSKFKECNRCLSGRLFTREKTW